MEIIIVTGTPGAGKTRLARKIAKEKGYRYIDVHKIIKKNRLYDGFDKKRDCYVVDTGKLADYLMKNIKKGAVVDSHMSHYLPREYVDECVVVKCDIKVLKERLEKRGYSERKVRENIDAEIFDVCLVEALEKGHNVRVVDTTKGI